MTLDLTPDELLTTTRTVRRRLDFDRSVDRDLIEECIDIAVQAPTGGLKQNWHWLVIGDPHVKKQIGEVYHRSWMSSSDTHVKYPYPADDPRGEQLARVLSSGAYLAENMDRAPWLVVPCGTGRTLGSPTVPEQVRFWGSVLPAMWSFMLAARVRGLGVAWTTAHLTHEEEVAEILGIPYPEVTQCGLFPVAYSVGTDFKRAHRIPGSELTHWDHW